MNVFFVCGAPKSGTTWLQRILDAHPEVSCAGEGHFIERFTIPVAKVVKAYNEALRLEAEQVYEDKPVYSPVDQAEFDAVARTFILGRLGSRAKPAARWLGDKTPRYTHHLGALHRIFPEARIFHIVRDPRDVAVSRLGHNRRIGLWRVETVGSPERRQAVHDAAAGWAEAVGLVDAFATAHPGLVHEVSYRALHDAPAETLAGLFGFLGVATETAVLEAVAAATSFEAITGRKAGEEDPNSFYRKGVPDDWQTRLDPEALAIIAEACGPLMAQKGFG